MYGFIGALVGGIIVWYTIISSFNTNNIGMMRMMGFQYGTQNSLANSESLDAHFIEQMIPHHDDAITMSKLAQAKAKRQEVKLLADNIIESQGKEIAQMKSWYSNWFGKEVPKGDSVMQGHGMMMGNRTHMGMMGDETDISRLEQAQNFDQAFLEAMIPHHQMAVMMANMLKNGTNRPEMEKLADDIINSQTKEINQMRTWLIEWE